MVLPVVMYGCESWAVKKAQCWRIDAFELWCWRRLLRVPWTARRANQSILKEISPGCSLEGLMLKLKLQYFSYLMQRADSLEKTLMLGDWGWEEKGMTEDEMVGWHHWLNGHEFGWTPGVGDGQGGLACCGSWGRKESDTTERLNWTELSWTELIASEQCCDGFRWRTEELSHTCTCILSPPDSPPSQTAPLHWAEFLSLCSRSLLVIQFKYSSVCKCPSQTP